MAKITKQDFISGDEFIARLPAARRAKVEARAKQLIAEELTMQELRKARNLTQTQLGAVLGIGQEHVSRIEQRADMLLSTLASYVNAMGGSLKLVIDFPDRQPVSLTNFAALSERDAATPRRRQAPAAAKRR